MHYTIVQLSAYLHSGHIDGRYHCLSKSFVRLSKTIVLAIGLPMVLWGFCDIIAMNYILLSDRSGSLCLSRWVVEYQVGNKGIILDNCKPNESIYIFGCKDSVIQVQGKSSGLFLSSTQTCTCTVSEYVIAD